MVGPTTVTSASSWPAPGRIFKRTPWSATKTRRRPRARRVQEAARGDARGAAEKRRKLMEEEEEAANALPKRRSGDSFPFSVP